MMNPDQVEPERRVAVGGESPQTSSARALPQVIITILILGVTFLMVQVMEEPAQGGEAIVSSSTSSSVIVQVIFHHNDQHHHHTIIIIIITIIIITIIMTMMIAGSRTSPSPGTSPSPRAATGESQKSKSRRTQSQGFCLPQMSLRLIKVDTQLLCLDLSSQDQKCQLTIRGFYLDQIR